MLETASSAAVPTDWYVDAYTPAPTITTAALTQTPVTSGDSERGDISYMAPAAYVSDATPAPTTDDATAADTLASAAGVNDDGMVDTPAPATDGNHGISGTMSPTPVATGLDELGATTTPIGSDEAALANGAAGTGIGSGVAVGSAVLPCAIGVLTSTIMSDKLRNSVLFVTV